MRTRTGRRPGRLLLAVVLLLLVTPLAGCGSTVKARAQKLADEVYPGRLQVVEVVNDVAAPVPFPVQRVVFRVLDDPDAAVTLATVDAGALRTAYDEGLRVAAELRRIRSAMATEQLEVAGLRIEPGTSAVSVYLGAEVSDATVTPLADRLDRVVARWSSTQPPTETKARSIAFTLVAPEVVAQLPAVVPDRPTVLQLGQTDRRDALARQAEFRVSVTVAPGRPARSVQTLLQPALSDVDQRAVEAVAMDAAGRWLTQNRPQLRAEGLDRLSTRLVYGSASQVRLYPLACSAGDATCRYTSPYRMGVTVDLATRTGGEVRLLQRPATGWPVPLEPPG